MKKVLALVLALVFALSLVACGGNNTSTPTATQEAPTEDRSAVIEALVDDTVREHVAETYPYADPEQTQITHSRAIEGENSVDVYGTYTMYDVYSNLTVGHSHPEAMGAAYTHNYHITIDLTTMDTEWDNLAG